MWLAAAWPLEVEADDLGGGFSADRDEGTGELAVMDEDADESLRVDTMVPGRVCVVLDPFFRRAPCLGKNANERAARACLGSFLEKHHT